MAVLNVSAAGVAAGLASAIGLQELLIILLALAMGYAYSLRPLLLSHRTLATPVVLSAFYVAVPYSLGAAIAGGGPQPGDGWLLGALLMLFTGRILLKDFRDREGDAQFHKPTFLLRYGKTATCAASAAAVAAGGVLLVPALNPPLPIALLLEAFIAGILWTLYRLWKAEGKAAEQSAIGLAAKTGNGLLIAVLGLLALGWRDAPAADQLAFTCLVLAVHSAAFYAIVSRPHDVIIGYRG
jgi:4-hydroxybenzoate polyprenyltransferase